MSRMGECPYCQSKKVASSMFRSRFECGSVVTTALGSERINRSTACLIIQALKYQVACMDTRITRYNRVVAERNAMEAHAIALRNELEQVRSENEGLRKSVGGLA